MAYNPFGEDVEDFSGQAATEEERKKKLARMASLMTGGVGLGDAAGQMLGERIAPIQSAITDPEAALKQRFGEPIQKAEQLGQLAQGPTGPVMPEQVAQERQLEALQTQPKMAQAPAMPVAPVNPAVQEVTSTQLPEAGPATQVAGPAQLAQTQSVNPAVQTPTPQVAEVSKTAIDDVFHNSFIEASNSKDPKERRAAFAALIANPKVPEGIKTQANQMFVTDYQNQRAQQDAMSKLEKATPNDIARYMQEKNKDEGSYVKAILFQRLGLGELAKQEQEKLSPSLTATSVTDSTGKRYTAYTNKTGEIVRAFNSEGNLAGQDELAGLSSNVGSMKGANIGSQLYRDPGTGKSLTKVDTATGPIYYDSTGNRTLPKGEPVPLTAGSDISTQLQLAQMKRQQQFVGQTAEERMRAFRETNSERALAGMTPLTPVQMGLNERGELIGQAMPGVPATPPQAQPQPALGAGARQRVPLEQQATVAPKPSPFSSVTPQPGVGEAVMTPSMPVAPTAPPTTAKTPAEIKAERLAKEEAAKLIVKPAAEQVAVSADTQNMLNSITKVEKILASEKHNIGSAAAAVVGRGPIAQAVGEQFETTDAKNTKLVLDTVNKLAADGLKLLGSNPSTADLQFWTQNKPNGSTDPEVMKEWVKSRSEDMKRRLGYAEKQVGAGGGAGVASPVYPEKTINGVTYFYDGQGWKKK